MFTYYNSALDMIGNTPLIELSRLHSGPGRLFAKAEFVQPGGSVKDRAAKTIIEMAYEKKILSARKPVIEQTSGNMGAGLAVVCAVKGNPFTAVMSAGNSFERVKMLRGLGAEVLLVDQVDGEPGKVTGKDIAKATEVAINLAKERNGYYVDQFNNPGSIMAHENSTGPELWNSFGEKLNAFITAVGSGGTFVGTSSFLKNKNSNIKCLAVEPLGAEILAKKIVSKPKHQLQGIGYGIKPPHWCSNLADGYLAVSDEEANHYRMLLALKEGLYVGFSAAANVAASVNYLNSHPSGELLNVATILCDTGLKY